MVDKNESRVTTRTGSGDTVLVACKLPNGLIMQLYDMVDGYEMTPQGRKETKVARKKDAPIKLNGSATRFGQMPDWDMSNGYGITAVPADFWNEWCRQNKDSPALENRLIFAAADNSGINGKTKEAKQDKVKSGMEPIDPKNPPKVGGLKVTPAQNMA